VVQVVDRPDISAAAATIVERLRLSGLLGFDFILAAGTGDAHLIEMNPRATQLSHLALGEGRELLTSLRAALTGDPGPAPPPATPGGIVALFPQEWLRDPASPFLTTAHHDVPWDQPALIRACVGERPLERIWTRVFP
jgi:hypothetical protein